MPKPMGKSEIELNGFGICVLYEMIQKLSSCHSLDPSNLILPLLLPLNTNVHVEKYQCEKCKRVCKESKYTCEKTIK